MIQGPNIFISSLVAEKQGYSFDPIRLTNLCLIRSFNISLLITFIEPPVSKNQLFSNFYIDSVQLLGIFQIHYLNLNL